ncbi:hypothetical protein [Streptosporangium sp. NPDC087985]|uniref:hypothetical protein n=1 Tax=Streptosporangium sp. NPDC087985 TaxID=3366196 RepID=UPI0037F2AAC4
MRLRSILTTISLVMVALVAPGASPAQAADCSGSLIEHIAIKTYGHLDVYYDSATKRNCVKTVSSSSTWGVSKPMAVYLVVCEETKPSSSCRQRAMDYDDGQYQYYAGPRSLPAGGRCIYAFGRIYSWEVSTSPITSHCG